MKLLGREISHRTSLILGILVLFALTAAGFGVYGLVSSESTDTNEAQNQLQRTGVLANPEQAAFPAPKPEGPALSSEDISETVSLPDSSVIDIALGDDHTCALHQDTTVSCWGSNGSGQIGAGLSDDIVGTPTKVKTEDSSGNLVRLTGIKAISAGNYHTCGLHQDTTVSCWGINSHPHANQGPGCLYTTTSGYTGPINGNCAGQILVSETKELSNVIQISSGGYRGCALLNSGTISCWRSSYSENIFIKNLAEGSGYLETVPDISDATAIAVGNIHACAIHLDMTVSCWGDGRYGRLGDGVVDTLASSGFANSRSVSNPTKTKKLDENNNLVDLTNVKSISAERVHTCAIHTDESLSCWGLTNYDLNDKEGDFIPPPSQESTYYSAQKITLTDTENNIIDTFSSVSVGENHRCAISKVQTKLYCWDINSSGQLGVGSYENSSLTLLNPVIHRDGYELTQVYKVTAGDRHTCAIHGQNNILSCWGDGSDSKLGYSTVLETDGGRSRLNFQNPKSFSTGTNFTCLIEGSRNTLRCFGRGDSGQLGNAGFEHQPNPAAVLDSTNTALFDVSAVSAGDKYGCAIHGADLKVSCWGTNNSNTVSSVPNSSTSRAVEIGIEGATSISVGYSHACAVDISGKASCWGDDTYGQLGSDNLMADFTQISAGYGHSCGIHTDRTVSCWGLDDGRLGHTGQINSKPSPTPTKVAGITDVDSISIGHSHTCVIWGEEDKVSCWGSNNLLQLGNPDISENSNTPVDVVNEAGSPLLSVAQISAGESTSCAIFEDSRISCWGSGAYRKLLDLNPNSDISYAVVLSSELFYSGSGIRFEWDNGRQISVGKNHICLIIDGNPLICWGSNYFGELGRGGVRGGSSTPVYVNF